MKNLNFYLFLFIAGVFFVFGKKDSSENENTPNASNNKTKNESDSEPKGKNMKYNQQSFLITPDDRLSINQRLFQNQKPGFLEGNDYIPPVRISSEGKRQNIHLSDDTGKYNVQLENFQYEKPTYFQAALGAISAHIINQKNQEYIPYPPNGDPYNYPSYRGHPHATEPPVIRAYERSSGSNFDAPPLMDYTQQSPRKIFANNIYQRTFPDFENFGPGFYSGSLFNNGAPEQIPDSEQINKWYKDQRGGYAPSERVF